MEKPINNPGGPLANADMGAEVEVVVKGPDGKVKQTVQAKGAVNEGFFRRMFKK